MNRLACLALLCVLAAPAAAWDGVQVLEAEGHLQQHYWNAPSPTPGYCYWDHQSADGTSFAATNADGYGNMDCPDPWFVHCDDDSLVFQGAWPVTDTEYVTGLEYVVDLTCTVEISETTRLRAGCAVTSGDLDTDVHTLTVTYADQSSEVLIAGRGGNVVRILPPGTYGIALQVRAYENRSYAEAVEAYTGRFCLGWEDPACIADTPVTWGSLKATFAR